MSCLRLNCHNVRDTLPHRRTRQRAARVSLKEASDDESEGASDSGMEEITGQTSSKKARSKASSKTSKSKGKEKEGAGDAMIVDPKPDAAPDASEAAPAPTPKRKGGRPRKSAASTAAESAEAPTGETSEAQDSPAPKKRGPGRPRKWNADGTSVKRGRGRPSKNEIGSVAFAVDPTPAGTQPTAETAPVPAPAPVTAPATTQGHAHSATIAIPLGQTTAPTATQPPVPVPPPGTQAFYRTFPTPPYVPAAYYPPPAGTSATMPSRAMNPSPSAVGVTPYGASPLMMIKQTPNSSPVLMLAPQMPQGARVTSVLPVPAHAPAPAPAPAPTAGASVTVAAATTPTKPASTRKRRQSKLHPDAAEGAAEASKDSAPKSGAPSKKRKT